MSIRNLGCIDTIVLGKENVVQQSCPIVDWSFIPNKSNQCSWCPLFTDPSSMSANYLAPATSQSYFATRNNTKVTAQKGGTALLPCTVLTQTSALVSIRNNNILNNCSKNNVPQPTEREKKRQTKSTHSCLDFDILPPSPAGILGQAPGLPTAHRGTFDIQQWRTLPGAPYPAHGPLGTADQGGSGRGPGSVRMPTIGAPGAIGVCRAESCR